MHMSVKSSYVYIQGIHSDAGAPVADCCCIHVRMYNCSNFSRFTMFFLFFSASFSSSALTLPISTWSTWWRPPHYKLRKEERHLRKKVGCV